VLNPYAKDDPYAKVHGFPGEWRDQSHHKRGAAWLFFPEGMGPQRRPDGMWTARGPHHPHFLIETAATTSATGALTPWSPDSMDRPGD
jgi:hypothetical protein